jgi:HAD superfamily hydrolase (TIGR01484 family)
MTDQLYRLTLAENLGALPGAFRRGLASASDVSAVRSTLMRANGWAVIGSGASYSGALLTARWLMSAYSVTAQAFTPYEYSLAESFAPGAILLSARGKNSDILAAAHVCLRRQVDPLLIVTGVSESPLHELVRDYVPAHVLVTHTPPPGQKEGFFGVQTLAAAIAVFAAQGGGPAHTFPRLTGEWADEVNTLSSAFIDSMSSAIADVASAEQVVVLGTDWASPAVADFESKWVEGGLGWIEHSESKNYTHGRYMNAQPARSAFIVFATADGVEFLDLFATALSGQFPLLTVVSREPSFAGACELMLRGCHLFAEFARLRQVDVSNPVLPSYATKLFAASPLYPELDLAPRLAGHVETCLSLKARALQHEGDSAAEAATVPMRSVVLASLAQLYSSRFCGLACDVDGTLLPLNERDGSLPLSVSSELNRLLAAGVDIAVVTGRGSSVLDILRAAVNEANWPNVYCYLRNGGVFVRLSEEAPEWVHTLSEASALSEMIRNLPDVVASGADISIDRHGTQVTVDFGASRSKLARTVTSIIRKEVVQRTWDAHVRESGACVDIFSSQSGKERACDHFSRTVIEPKGSSRVLLLGDSGHVGGNDHEMLQLPFSMSVGTVHWSPNTCFPVLDSNLTQRIGPEGTAFLLSSATVGQGWFRLNL